jgi:hypothetical protein
MLKVLQRVLVTVLLWVAILGARLIRLSQVRASGTCDLIPTRRGSA